MVTISTFLPSAFSPLSSSLLSTPSLPTSVVSALFNPAFHEHYNIILGTQTLQSGSYMSTNVISIIWVQYKSFRDWQSAWTWVYAIECMVMHKRCVIDLVGQKIRMKNTFTKIFEQIVKLIKRDE